MRTISMILFGALLVACSDKEPAPKQPRSERAQISNDVEATADVVAVEPAGRLVTLRREDDLRFQVKAGPEVRNFDKIAVGARLRVRYKETLTASRLPAGEDAAPMEGVVAAARAAAGETPAGGVAIGLSVRV